MQVRLNETFECVVGLVFRIKFTLILKLFKSLVFYFCADYYITHFMFSNSLLNTLGRCCVIYSLEDYISKLPSIKYR